jgi:hypothetical protein
MVYCAILIPQVPKARLDDADIKGSFGNRLSSSRYIE